MSVGGLAWLTFLYPPLGAKYFTYALAVGVTGVAVRLSLHKEARRFNLCASQRPFLSHLRSKLPLSKFYAWQSKAIEESCRAYS